MPGNKSILILALILGVFALVKTIKKPSLKYFTPSEFGPWYPMINNDLLLKLDHFRQLMGSPVYISPVSGAIGRNGGHSDNSQHNVDKWGEVLAIDVFPTIDGEYIQTRQQRSIVLDNAKKAGFTGIGLYTDTSPGNMLHIDVRSTDSLALWSRIQGQYLGIDEALIA